VRSYFVTGGAGFIGSHLVQAILEQGDRVIVLDNFSTGRSRNLEESISASGLAEPGLVCWADPNYKPEKKPSGARLIVIEGDVRDLELCRRLMVGVDYVLHQAAVPSVPRSIEDPLSTHAANVDGTFYMLLAAKESRDKTGKPSRFVAASSSSVYGDTPTLPKIETMPPCPLSPYAASKLVGETYGQVFARTLGLPTVFLRYFNVYGPRQDPNSAYAAAIPRFISRLLSDQPPQIFGDGRQSRDFTFVEDCVRANLLACTAETVSGEVFNVGSGGRIEIGHLCALLSELTGKRFPPQYLSPRSGDVLHSQADISKARLMLNYRPAFDIHEGLKRTLDAWTKTAPVQP